jgi:hypothetical protein
MLSPTPMQWTGLRSISAYHREHPCVLEAQGLRATIDSEPAESTTSSLAVIPTRAGRSGCPLNYLLVSVLERYARFLGAEATIEYPTASGRLVALDSVIDDLRGRLISSFPVGPDARRPCFGGVERMQRHPACQDNILFYRVFQRDDAGLGASHQTSQTGIVADMIRLRHGATQNLARYYARSSVQ